MHRSTKRWLVLTACSLVLALASLYLAYWNPEGGNLEGGYFVFSSDGGARRDARDLDPLMRLTAPGMLFSQDPGASEAHAAWKNQLAKEEAQRQKQLAEKEAKRHRARIASATCASAAAVMFFWTLLSMSRHQRTLARRAA